MTPAEPPKTDTSAGRSVSARDRLIVALDVANAAETQRLVGALGDSVSHFKIGLQLFTAEGPGLVRDLVSSGRRVFLDLKLHDIPNTVAAAVRSAAELRVDMLTVHAAGGSKMLRAAAEAAAASAHPPLVLAVTVLTSMADEDVQEVGVSGRAMDQVLRLANLAKSASCGGVVASPQEVGQLRQALGAGFAIVTPGIRPAGADRGDQARIATPAEAIRAGASHLVIGRPITGASDPKAAAEAILREIG
jgi:orotidine-5'-phosphate decarboxylase